VQVDLLVTTTLFSLQAIIIAAFLMNIFASWEQRRAEKRALKQAEQRAKAKSDEIDRQLQEERRRRSREKQHDILLIGS
jgi:hypothetical protein